MRAPLVWLFAILVVPQRHIRCVECMHGLPEDVVVPFLEGKISKFDKHMLLNWVTQPLTRHLFPVDFFQNLLESAKGYFVVWVPVLWIFGIPSWKGLLVLWGYKSTNPKISFLSIGIIFTSMIMGRKGTFFFSSLFGEMIQFDLRTFFRWVVQPPTSS